MAIHAPCTVTSNKLQRYYSPEGQKRQQLFLNLYQIIHFASRRIQADIREILEIQEKHKKSPNEELFPLNSAIAKSKLASGYFDSNGGAVVSGAKVGQLNFLSDVIVNQIGLGADNANLRRRFLRPAVEFALSSPGIGEQHQVPVFSIVIS